MRIAYAIAVGLALLFTVTYAMAEVYHKGKVYTITADRYIRANALPCAYGVWTSETLPNGSTLLVRAKRCEARETSNGR